MKFKVVNIPDFFNQIVCYMDMTSPQTEVSLTKLSCGRKTSDFKMTYMKKVLTDIPRSSNIVLVKNNSFDNPKEFFTQDIFNQNILIDIHSNNSLHLYKNIANKWRRENSDLSSLMINFLINYTSNQEGIYNNSSQIMHVLQTVVDRKDNEVNNEPEMNDTNNNFSYTRVSVDRKSLKLTIDLSKYNFENQNAEIQLNYSLLFQNLDNGSNEEFMKAEVKYLAKTTKSEHDNTEYIELIIKEYNLISVDNKELSDDEKNFQQEINNFLLQNLKMQKENKYSPYLFCWNCYTSENINEFFICNIHDELYLNPFNANNIDRVLILIDEHYSNEGLRSLAKKYFDLNKEYYENRSFNLENLRIEELEEIKERINKEENLNENIKNNILEKIANYSNNNSNEYTFNHKEIESLIKIYPDFEYKVRNYYSNKEDEILQAIDIQQQNLQISRKRACRN